MAEPLALVIRRFASVYCCAPAPDGGARLRDRLDALARRSVGVRIEALSAPLRRAEDEGLWLIRRLEVDCAINLAWDDERVARVWAGQVVAALAAQLATEGGGNALRFESEAAYLARFVVDLASGDAWSKWYYRRYAGLAALPASAGIRSALVAARETGAQALRDLPARECTAVLEALAPDDALTVLLMCAGLPDRLPLDEAAALAGRHARSAFRHAPDDPRWALAVFVAASRAADGGGAALLAAVAALAAHALRGARNDGRRAGPRDGTPGTGLPRWIERLGGLDALARLPRQRLASLVGSAADRELDATRNTAFGGGFLLLPLLAELPLEAWTAGWPAPAGVPASAALRALLLAKCLGQARCLGFLADPLWREILGLPADVDWPAVVGALGRTDAKRRSLRRRVERRPATLVAASAPPAHRIAADPSGRAWRIVDDEPGYWHRLAPLRGRGGTAKPDADLGYLGAPAELALPRAWDAVLSLAAQQVLRGFARRLPGFGLSGLDYLYRNFLAMSARVDIEAGRYVVRLTRPPLALMLNLTGLTRAGYELPWLPGRACALYPEEA